MKLRTRLTVGLAAVAVAFAVVAYLVASTQHRYLGEQLDRRLQNAIPLASNLIDDRFVVVPPDETADFTEVFIGHLDLDGTLTTIVQSSLTDSVPEVTVEQARQHGRGGGPGQVELFTTGSTGSEEFRVAVLQRPQRPGWDLIALSTQETEDASDRLLLALGLGFVGVLGVIAVIWWWVVRLGVRPITEMTAAADAITHGERSRRMPQYPARTEAQHLSTAFNEMIDARDEADGRLRQFVADASHELRTPLTSIRGYADLYQQGAFREQERLDDAMRRVSGEAERMTRIVNDLLLLSKLDRGIALDVQHVDLAATIDDVVADARAVQPDRPITADVEHPLACAADAERIHQVLAALVHNALVHTPGDTAIEIRGARADGAVLLEVVDHGPGMDADTAAHAFERFYRGDPSRTRNSGGSGLGLSIAQSIVEAHGGRISLQTAPGAGCHFRIALPLSGPTPA